MKSHMRRPEHRQEREILKEAERLLITAQNNTIRINCVYAKIGKTQQNSKCRLCGDRDETINHIKSKSRKLAPKKYKTRQNWVGKVIYWELCKKLTSDHTKWYMHKPESVLEDKTHKIHWDFEIQTDHLISARWPDILIVNKEKKKESAE